MLMPLPRPLQEPAVLGPEPAEESALRRCPRILVLMASRNGAQWIEAQIRSVLAQRGVAVQLDVRDDDSSDATRMLLTQIADEAPQVRLRPDHRNTGSAAANFFELIATASLDDQDYVALCDQDDVWSEDKLQSAVQQLSASGAAGYSAAVTAVWPDGRKKLLSQAATLRSADYLFEGAGQGCTFVFTAPWFRQLQLSVARHRHLLGDLHYHDWALYALTRSAGGAWCFDSQPRMMYRQHAGNDTGARTTEGGVSRRLALIRSGWYRMQIDAICALVLTARPADSAAAEWSARSAGQGWRGRLRRGVFILRHGRRRMTDRIVQTIAVGAGCL